MSTITIATSDRPTGLAPAEGAHLTSAWRRDDDDGEGEEEDEPIEAVGPSSSMVSKK